MSDVRDLDSTTTQGGAREPEPVPAEQLTEVGDREDTLGGDDPAVAPPRPLQRGDVLGRYVILERIGAGGMSVVYTAYDPELDRRVAIKVLLPGRARGRHSDGARARLVREAQAIARVSHPNVIAVHDVGVEHGHVFIAMEYVVGSDLAKWIRTRPDAARVIEVFRQAGQGLAAAHAAGLVHRDFKPENVLLGDDGRVRVVDFGIVRRDEDHDPELRSDASAGMLPVGDNLTVAGSVIGTPAYMAPELFDGLRGDALSDQFAYCVSFYEALYGDRPFVGTSATELYVDMTTAKLKPQPRARAVPPHVSEAVVRGLSRDPSRRFASMRELLDALVREDRNRAPRWVAGAATLALLSAAAWVALAPKSESTPDDPCRGGAQRRAEVWSEPRVERMRSALLATGDPSIAAQWPRIDAAVEGYLDNWQQVYDEGCRAARVTGDRSENLFDLQTVCLDARMRAVDATARTFEAATVSVTTQARDLVQELPPVEPCADLEALADRLKPPEDPQVRAAVERVRDDLAQVEVLDKTDRSEEAARLMAEVHAHAFALDYLPLHGEVLAQEGDRAYRDESGQASVPLYDRAFTIALQSGHDDLGWQAAVHLCFVLADDHKSLAAAESWCDRAEALARRANGPDYVDLHTLMHRALLAQRAGRPLDALVIYSGALALTAGRTDSAMPYAAVLNNMAATAAESWVDHDTMWVMLASLVIHIAELGPRHVETLRSRGNLASILLREGEPEAAMRLFESMLADAQGAPWEHHPQLLNARAALGRAYRILGRLDEAESVAREVIARMEVLFGPQSYQVAENREALGLVEYDQGRVDAAGVDGELALAGFEAADARPSRLITTLHLLARVRADQGRMDDALALETRALELAEQHMPSVAGLVGCSLGRLELARGQREEARTHIERARASIAREEDAETRAGYQCARLGIVELGDFGPLDGARARAELDDIATAIGDARGEDKYILQAVDALRGKK